MSHKQAGKLIIENIQMLEEAIRLLGVDLSQEIFDVCSGLIQQDTFLREY